MDLYFYVILSLIWFENIHFLGNFYADYENITETSLKRIIMLKAETVLATID